MGCPALYRKYKDKENKSMLLGGCVSASKSGDTPQEQWTRIIHRKKILVVKHSIHDELAI